MAEKVISKSSWRQWLSRLYYEKGIRARLGEYLTYMKVFHVFLKPAPVRYIVFAQGRSGSTLLVDLLNCLPGNHCDGEIFGAEAQGVILFPKLLMHQRSRGDAKAYGCRIKIYDLTDSQNYSEAAACTFIRECAASGWRIVYLHRKNIFKQALSSMVAEARNTYHHKAGSGRSDIVTLDSSSLLYRLRLLRDFERREKDALHGINHLALSYEVDLLNNAKHQESLDKLAQFLNLPKAEASTQYLRTSTDNPADYIANYKEISAQLLGTEFEYLVNE